MIKRNIIIIIIIIVFSLIIISKYLTIKIDPCDVECDNCIDMIQCNECYEQCYERLLSQ